MSTITITKHLIKSEIKYAHFPYYSLPTVCDACIMAVYLVELSWEGDDYTDFLYMLIISTPAVVYIRIISEANQGPKNMYIFPCYFFEI